MTSPQGRRIGSIADLDPVNDFYGSLSADYNHPANNHQPPPPPSNSRPTSGVSTKKSFVKVKLCHAH